MGRKTRRNPGWDRDVEGGSCLRAAGAQTPAPGQGGWEGTDVRAQSSSLGCGGALGSPRPGATRRSSGTARGVHPARRAPPCRAPRLPKAAFALACPPLRGAVVVVQVQALPPAAALWVPEAFLGHSDGNAPALENGDPVSSLRGGGAAIAWLGGRRSGERGSSPGLPSPVEFPGAAESRAGIAEGSGHGWHQRTVWSRFVLLGACCQRYWCCGSRQGLPAALAWECQEWPLKRALDGQTCSL